MANYAGGVLTVCPYYEAEAGKSIRCNGFLTGSSTALRFCSGQQKDVWQHAYCFRHDYNKCPIAFMLYASQL